MKKIWITGASGHVGRALTRLLDCRQYDILATDAQDGDITDVETVRTFFRNNQPDIVINCAGLTDLQACEKNPDRAYLVNALGVRNLAQEAQNIHAKLIQISTDDVFGTDRNVPYNEFDPISPRSIYGKSKAAGEQFIKDLMTRYVIIRSSWVYGTGKDFVNDVLNAVENGGVLHVASNQFSTPTSAKELARIILGFLENDAYGTYHAVCKGFCSRYDYAREILALTDNTHNLAVEPFIDESNTRPRYSVLDNLMLRISGMTEPKDWKEALAEYLAETPRHA
ncbi:MAG: dTDP-4-dehydrorhamnose reductase [Clostridiales bacterium]|nr:dTDP-4-dehydrorhamnose reductase [Clostridiales bacterium]